MRSQRICDASIVADGRNGDALTSIEVESRFRTARTGFTSRAVPLSSQVENVQPAAARCFIAQPCALQQGGSGRVGRWMAIDEATTIHIRTTDTPRRTPLLNHTPA